MITSSHDDKYGSHLRFKFPYATLSLYWNSEGINTRYAQCDHETVELAIYRPDVDDKSSWLTQQCFPDCGDDVLAYGSEQDVRKAMNFAANYRP